MARPRRVPSGFALLPGCLLLLSAWAAPVRATLSEVKLVDANGSAGAQLGYDVAIDGPYAIAGAPLDGTSGTEAGKAVVYFFDGASWTQQDELLPTVAPADGRFGWSVDLSGALAVVGAPYLVASGASPGLAYVFRRSGTAWNLEQVLAPGDGVDDDRFGQSVAVHGDTIVVGAPAQASGGGAVYVYVPTGPGGSPPWALQQKLGPAIGPGTFFGGSVDVWGDLMVGSTTASANGGYVHTHRRTAGVWSITQLLEGSDTVPSDAFGRSVAADDDRLLVGANLHVHGASHGAGYVLERDPIGGSWPEKAELLEVSAGIPANLGTGAGLDGDLATLGALYGDGLVTDSGTVHAYREASDGTWKEVATLSASDGFAQQNFGGAASVSGDCVLVGASSDDDQGAFAGAAYVYCGIPDLLVEVVIDIICCVQIPDYSTSPVEFTTRFTNVSTEPRTIGRWVDLIDPEGNAQRIVPAAEMEILEGASWSQDFETSRHVGGPPGVYSLVTSWQDGEQIQTEMTHFEMIGAASVPALSWPAAAGLAAGLLAAGRHRSRRRTGSGTQRHDR